MTIELRDLRWAIVAAQHRSLRQAAEALNIRQSTLSRGLRDLEYQFGATLFERTNGGTRPTAQAKNSSNLPGTSSRKQKRSPRASKVFGAYGAGIRFAENKSSAKIESTPA